MCPGLQSLRGSLPLDAAHSGSTETCPDQQGVSGHTAQGMGRAAGVIAEVRSCWEIPLSLLTLLSITGPDPACVHRVPSMGQREQAEFQPLLTPVAHRTPLSVKDKEAQIPLGYPGQASAPF